MCHVPQLSISYTIQCTRQFSYCPFHWKVPPHDYDHGKQTTSCVSFVAYLSDAVNVTWVAYGVGSCDSLLSAKRKLWMALLWSVTKDIQLVVCLPWSCTGAFSSGRGSMKAALDSVRNGCSLKFLSVLKSSGLGLPHIRLRVAKTF